MLDLSFAKPGILHCFLVGLSSNDYCDYPKVFPTGSINLVSKHVTINALVYALSGKFQVAEVKKIAFEKSVAAFKIRPTVNGFISAAEVIWTHVPSSDYDLRPYYFNILKKNMYTLFNSTAFCQLVRASGELGKDAFSLMVSPERFPLPSELYFCGRCKGLGKNRAKCQDLKCRSESVPKPISRFIWLSGVGEESLASSKGKSGVGRPKGQKMVGE